MLVLNDTAGAKKDACEGDGSVGPDSTMFEMEGEALALDGALSRTGS